MRKFCFALMMLLLAGCAGGKSAYQAQADAANAGLQTIQKGLDALATDVSKSCAGNEFKARFAALDAGLDALRAQISSITFAADAELDAAKFEIQKRNIAIFGLIAVLILAAYYGIRYKKIG